MSNPFAFVPQEILPRLSRLKPYTVLLLKKGENYNHDDTPRIIQSEHLPYLFRLEDEGVMCFSLPLADNGDLAGIGVYTTADKKQAKQYAENDPAVKQKVFTYELLSGMGIEGKTLL